MPYLSLDVRLYVAGQRAVSSERIRFHTELVSLCFAPDDVSRLGSKLTTALDPRIVLNNPFALRDAILDSTPGGTVAPVAHQSFDAMVIDFTAHSTEVREGLLVGLADAVDTLAGTAICRQFLILLPTLPPSSPRATGDLPFWIRLSEREMKSDRYTVLVFDAHGEGTSRSNPPRDVSALLPQYRLLRAEHVDDARSVLSANMVRRLGHFPSQRRGRRVTRCRRYSFVLDGCDSELVACLTEWVSRLPEPPQQVIYDAHLNPWFREAVRAFSERKQLPHASIRDVLALGRKVLDPRAASALVVDVVDSGDTVRRHLTALSRHRFRVISDLAAAIGSTSIDSFWHSGRNYGLTSIIQCPQLRVSATECPQCSLGLAHTQDAQELDSEVRSYDFWDMAEDEEVGWEPEPEVPDNIGYGYAMVPRFAKMLERYGDWLSYKMARRLGDCQASSVFVIHPQEPDSALISQKLRIRFRREIIVVEVPRIAIKRAQEGPNRWQAILEEGANETWVQQLRSFSLATSAVIVDVFNASGSTYRSLHSLLRFLDIPVHCYFPMVERDPERADQYSIERRRLYVWYGPRRMKARVD